MPPGFPGALPQSFDRAFVQRNTEHAERDRASRDSSSPDTGPSEGSGVMMKSESRRKAKTHVRSTRAQFLSRVCRVSHSRGRHATGYFGLSRSPVRRVPTLASVQ